MKGLAVGILRGWYVEGGARLTILPQWLGEVDARRACDTPPTAVGWGIMGLSRPIQNAPDIWYRCQVS
jgi:hypothetical protein